MRSSERRRAAAALCRAGCVAALCGGTTGCAIVSPMPLWELAKGAGAVASVAIPYGASTASNTVYHLHPLPRQVCIEFNPDTAVADIVPALQIELRTHRIESRLYDVGPATAGSLSGSCPVWLRYEASIAWDTPPMGGAYRAYVNGAALTLQSPDGVVLSSSHYELGTEFGAGKWASTQRKLAPVVSALVTGFQN